MNGKADGLIRMRMQTYVETADSVEPVDVTFEYTCGQCKTEVAIPRQWQLESEGN